MDDCMSARMNVSLSAAILSHSTRLVIAAGESPGARPLRTVTESTVGLVGVRERICVLLSRSYYLAVALRWPRDAPSTLDSNVPTRARHPHGRCPSTRGRTCAQWVLARRSAQMGPGMATVPTG